MRHPRRYSGRPSRVQLLGDLQRVLSQTPLYGTAGRNVTSIEHASKFYSSHSLPATSRTPPQEVINDLLVASHAPTPLPGPRRDPIRRVPPMPYLASKITDLMTTDIGNIEPLTPIDDNISATTSQKPHQPTPIHRYIPRGLQLLRQKHDWTETYREPHQFERLLAPAISQRSAPVLREISRPPQGADVMPDGLHLICRTEPSNVDIRPNSRASILSRMFKTEKSLHHTSSCNAVDESKGTPGSDEEAKEAETTPFPVGNGLEGHNSVSKVEAKENVSSDVTSSSDTIPCTGFQNPKPLSPTAHSMKETTVDNNYYLPSCPAPLVERNDMEHILYHLASNNLFGQSTSLRQFYSTPATRGLHSRAVA